MLAPSIRAAVTVAPAIGSFAEFVTTPTIAPAARLTAAGAEESSAWTTGKTVPVARTTIRRPLRYFCKVIDLILYLAPQRLSVRSGRIVDRPKVVKKRARRV